LALFYFGGLQLGYILLCKDLPSYFFMIRVDRLFASHNLFRFTLALLPVEEEQSLRKDGYFGRGQHD
jgi:hypothetical protein